MHATADALNFAKGRQTFWTKQGSQITHRMGTADMNFGPGDCNLFKEDNPLQAKKVDKDAGKFKLKKYDNFDDMFD